MHDFVVIFADMGKAARSILYSLIAFAFVLLMIDYVSFNLNSVNNTAINVECEDFSMHCEHTHSHYLEDEIPYYEPLTLFHKTEIPENFRLSDNPDLTNIFISEIWQPPKNS